VNESPYQVLDARRIKRIEAVHGDFLYQHLLPRLPVSGSEGGRFSDRG
jgi:hypothetical protein